MVNNQIASVTIPELQSLGYAEKSSQRGTIYFEDSGGSCVAKLCSKCGEIKYAKYFSNHKRSLCGLESSCKICKSKSVGRWYQENKERILEDSKKKYLENRDFYILRSKPQNKDVYREWYLRNKDRKLETNRTWLEKNKEHASKVKKEWSRNNLPKVNLSRSIRRAQKASLPSTLDTEQLDGILNYFNGGCALTNSLDTHYDHVIPLNIGHGGTIIGNIIPLRSDLNISKSASHIFEWFESNRQRFNLSQEKFDSLIEYLSETNQMTPQEYRMYVDWCFDNPRKLKVRDVGLTNG